MLCLDGELLFALGLTKTRSVSQPWRCGWPAQEREQVWEGKWGELVPPTSSWICPSAGTFLPRRWQAAGQVGQLAVTAAYHRPPAETALLFWCGVTSSALELVKNKAPESRCKLSPSNQGFTRSDPALCADKELVLSLCCWLCFCLDLQPWRWTSWKVQSLRGRFQVWKEEGSFVSFPHGLVPCSVPRPLPTSHSFCLCLSWWKSFSEDFSPPGNLSAKSVMWTISSVQIKRKMTCTWMHFCYDQTQEWIWSPSSSILSLAQEKISFKEPRPEALPLLSLNVSKTWNLLAGQNWQGCFSQFLLPRLSHSWTVTHMDINRHILRACFSCFVAGTSGYLNQAPYKMTAQE